MDESELLNLPEDEFDAFNDETFGDVGEYNWEQNQAMFDDFLGSEVPNGKKKKAAADRASDEEVERTVPSSKAQEDYYFYAGQSKETEYDEFENENALEESISRLVLDEFDDDEEAVANEKLRRITATKSSYYFMPPQVVNRNLQWFMEKELPGGNSLLGSSVWSMHPTSISTRSEADDNSGMNAMYGLPKSSADNLEKAEANSSPGLPVGPDLGNLLGLTKVPNAANVQATPVVGSKPPAFKTVDEIEQELLRESEMAKVPAKPAVEETKPRPKIMSLEELERQLIQESPAAQSSAEAPQQVSSQQGRPTAADVPGLHPDMIRSLRGPVMVPPGLPGQVPVPGSMPAAQGSVNANLYFARHGIPSRPLPRPVGFSHNSFAQNIMNSAAAHAALQQLQIRQQQMRFMQMNSSGQFFPAGANQAVPMAKIPFRFPGNQPHPNNLPSHTHRRQDAKTDNGDAGLMTEKDKQRLKNIQIVQLQNDHPHTTDYYCLMRKVRRGGNGQRPMDILKVLFPRRSEEDDSNKRHYEPAHFENSLGKLQAQSALAPKKAIDTVIRVIDSGPAAGKKKSYRYVLLEIEKMYECLLALEEADLRVVLETFERDDDGKNMGSVREKVVTFLQDSKKLSEVMTVKKGKILVCRLAALIDQPVRMDAVRHLFKNFPGWAVSPTTTPGSTELVELFPYIRHCVLSMDAHSLECLCVELDDDVYNSMVTTKLGVSMIMVLLHRGEKLIRGPEVSDQFKAIWSKTVYGILAALLRNKQIVTPPVELYLVGLQRLLSSDLHRLNQHATEELSKLLTGFLNAGAKQIKQDY